MRRSVWMVGMVVVAALAIAACFQACAQPGQGPDGAMGGPPGRGGPGGQMMGPLPPGGPPAVAPAVAIADGVVYVACDGKITAFEARTLKKLSEARYMELPPARDKQGPPDRPE